MTLIAGALARGDLAQIPESLVKSIAAGLSRDPECIPRIFRQAGVAVAKAEIGAFSEAGHLRDSDGSVSWVCGEPLLDDRVAGPYQGRYRDLRILHQATREDGLEILSRCDGVFSFIHLSADGSRLTLATDHLGIRPLYYMVTPELFVFSSTLRLLQLLPELPRSLDLRGVAEAATLGYSLGRRTPIGEVSRLMPAEALRVSRSGEVESERYFSWEHDVAVHAEESAVSTRRVFDLFVRGVERRLRSDSATIAFLSGGLDSRCIVSALRHRGTAVHTFNFAVPGMQDEVFARRFAEAAGTTHHVFAPRLPASVSDASWSFRLREASEASGAAEHVDRPRLVWSGDGGSVCVGAVYIGDHRARVLAGHDFATLVDDFAPSIPIGVVASGGRRHLRGFLNEGVSEELSRIDVADPLRRFHLFLLFNDQRRHLDGHFEEIDLHGIEYQLPFFDSTFLKEVLRTPVAYLRKHRFYHDWIREFPAFATTVPWQTYPGHLPCPLPYDDKLQAQWGAQNLPPQKAITRSARRVRLRRLREMILSGSFPARLLSRGRLLAGGLMYAGGLRDYAYVVDFAYNVFRHARTTTHIHDWPQDSGDRHA